MNFSIGRFGNYYKAGWIVLSLLCALFPFYAYAACSNPSGVSGMIEYQSNAVFSYCDDTNWVDMTGAPTNGLIAHWKMEETGGTSMEDSAGGYDGTWNGTGNIVSATGKIGGAVQFNGTDNYVDAGAVYNTASPVTIAAWIKPDNILNLTEPTVLSNRTAGNQGFTVGLDDGVGSPNVGNMAFTIQGVAQYKSSGLAIQEDIWQHVAWVYDGSKVVYYLNGAYLDEDSTGSMTTGSNMVIGEMGPPGFAGSDYDFPGVIDDLRLYNRALSAVEIEDLYNSTSGKGACAASGQMYYDSGNNVMNWCNGSALFNMGATTRAVLSDWNRRAPLTIDSSQVNSDLTNFPVLLTEDTLPSEMFDSDGSYPAQADGGDIRFTSDVAGTMQLAAEIVEFTTDTDPANGTAEIWVKVPSVSSSSDTTIYVWYNAGGGKAQPAVTDTYGRNSVWSNYAAVYHFEEDPSGSAPQMIDSTGNGNNGTSGGSMASDDSVSNTLFGGNALDFDGVNDVITVPDSNTLDSTSNLTVGVWMNVDTWTGGNQRNILKKDGNYLFRVDYNTSTPHGLSAYWWDNSGIRQLKYGAYNVTGSWQHLGFKVSSNDFVDFYLNGAPQSITPGNFNTSGARTITNQVEIASAAGGTEDFDGRMDEVRISTLALSNDYLAAEYANQSDPGGFVTAGSAQSNAASCASAGTLRYSASDCRYQFCDGLRWNYIPPLLLPDAPIVVQVSADTASGTGVLMTGVTAGNALVVLLQNSSTDVRSWQTSDNVEGAWSNELNLVAGGSRRIYAAYFLNHTGGNVTVTTSVTSATERGTYQVLEVSGVDTFDTDIGWVSYDTTGTNVNPALPFTPAINTPNASVTFLTLVNNATVGAALHTFGEAGWVEVNDATQKLSGYRIDATGATGITGSVTQSTARETGAIGFTLKANTCP